MGTTRKKARYFSLRLSVRRSCSTTCAPPFSSWISTGMATSLEPFKVEISIETGEATTVEGAARATRGAGVEAASGSGCSAVSGVLVQAGWTIRPDGGSGNA